MDYGLKEIVKVLSIGGIWALGIAWQVWLVGRDDRFGARRTYVPLGLGAIIFLGVMGANAVALTDPKSSVTVGGFLGACGKALLFWLAILLKAYLAPILLAFTGSCWVYYYFTYGVPQLYPILSWIFVWCLPFAPTWISQAYQTILILAALSLSLYDSLCPWTSIFHD